MTKWFPSSPAVRVHGRSVPSSHKFDESMFGRVSMMFHVRLLALSMVALSCVMFLGCGHRGPKTAPVSGVVTLDGKPLPEGSLMFLPEDANLPAEGADIKDGKFHFLAKPGKNKVEIRATRPPLDGKAVPDPTLSTHTGIKFGWEQYLPARYNSQSELRADVSDDSGGGKNKFQFALKSDQ